MPCKHYKNALIEAAATGTDLTSAAPADAKTAALRAHLDSCSSCRTAFEQEQSLFASIDAGLQVTANAEMPASLLPHVRARLDEAVAPQRRWVQPLIFAAASVALAFALFLLARPNHSSPDNQAKQTPQIPVSEPPATNARHDHSGASTQIGSSNVSIPQTRGRSTLLRPVASSQPEVLVPPDEREAFSYFVLTVQQRHDVAAALLEPSPKKQDALVTLEPLQIVDLELKPLEGRATELSGRVGEQR